MERCTQLQAGRSRLLQMVSINMRLLTFWFTFEIRPFCEHHLCITLQLFMVDNGRKNIIWEMIFWLRHHNTVTLKRLMTKICLQAHSLSICILLILMKSDNWKAITSVKSRCVWIVSSAKWQTEDVRLYHLETAISILFYMLVMSISHLLCVLPLV